MSEHEKWFESLNENGETVYFLGNEHKVSKMAWDFQQAKIDELQKRIDEALQLLEYNEYTDSALQAIDILKGNKDEN